MNIVDLVQRSDEWLVWRAEGITATDVPVILGLSPYKTPWQLWAEKTGRINPPDLSGNPNVQRGNRLEDEARQKTETRYNEILLPLCGECTEWPVLRASFDGVDANEEPYEFKAPSQNVWVELETSGTHSATFKLYEAQVQTQMVVAGASKGRLIFYREDGTDLDFEVLLTPERRAEILTAAKQFWELVCTETPPKLDPERDWYIPASGTDKFKWEAHADAWRSQQHRIKSLKDELKALEKDQKDVQRAMTTLMGTFKRADIGGVKVTRFEKAGSVDYLTYLKDMFPDRDVSVGLEAYRKPSRSEVRFTKSEDDLVNPGVDEVITSVKSAYF
jgi:putative phage-type endonuclease